MLAKPVTSNCQAVRGQAEVAFCLSPDLVCAMWGQAGIRGDWLRFGLAWGRAEVGFCLSPFELVFGSGWLGDRQRPVFACPQFGLELGSRLWTRVGWCGSGPGEILARGRAEVRFCLVRGQAAVGFCLSPVRACPRFGVAWGQAVVDFCLSPF
jgi:hypothetical protein